MIAFSNNRRKIKLINHPDPLGQSLSEILREEFPRRVISASWDDSDMYKIELNRWDSESALSIFLLVWKALTNDSLCCCRHGGTPHGYYSPALYIRRFQARVLYSARPLGVLWYASREEGTLDHEALPSLRAESSMMEYYDCYDLWVLRTSDVPVVVKFEFSCERSSALLFGGDAYAPTAFRDKVSKCTLANIDE